MRFVALSMVILVGLASCGTAEQSATSSSSSAPPVVETTTVAAETTVATQPTPAPTDAPPATVADVEATIFPTVDEPVGLDPVVEVEIAGDYYPTASAIGPDDVVVALLASSDYQDETPYLWSSASGEVVEALPLFGIEAPEFPYWGATIDWFDGRWYVFLAGDPDAADLAPTTLVSDDAISWLRLDMTVQMQASMAARFTPGWPYEGASAVMDTASDETRIVAAGWATVDGVVVPVTWTSSDGELWHLKVLRASEADQCANYGANVGASALGVMVDLFGCTYYGAGALFSEDGVSFAEVDGYQEGEALSITQLLGWYGDKLVAFRGGTQPEASTLRLTTNGEAWEAIALPDVATDIEWVQAYAFAGGVVVGGRGEADNAGNDWLFTGTEWRPVSTLDGFPIDSFGDRLLVGDEFSLRIVSLVADES